jgi:hypothetical protein
MQVSRNGEIINAPKFLIHGDDRRKLKKRAAKIQQAINYFWQMIDTNEVYGLYFSNEKNEQDFNSLKNELSGIKEKLSIPFIR